MLVQGRVWSCLLLILTKYSFNFVFYVLFTFCPIRTYSNNLQHVRDCMKVDVDKAGFVFILSGLWITNDFQPTPCLLWILTKSLFFFKYSISVYFDIISLVVFTHNSEYTISDHYSQYQLMSYVLKLNIIIFSMYMYLSIKTILLRCGHIAVSGRGYP